MVIRKFKYKKTLFFVILLFVLLLLVYKMVSTSLQREGMTNVQPSFLFIKRIQTEPHSIFYSLVWYNDAIYCFYRKYFIGREIKVVRMNTNFEIVDGTEELLVGSDPRCFFHNGRLYITDNKNENNKLIDYESKEYIPIQMDGKNLEYISHVGSLYLMYTMMPFVLYKVDVSTGECLPVQVADSDVVNNEYRGGTPGYPTNIPGIYYGFGHRTYKRNAIMTHDPFLWFVDMTGDQPSIRISHIDKPSNAQNICDPTSVIEIDGKAYLITAESEKEWFERQDYMTNVYELINYDAIMNVSVQ